MQKHMVPNGKEENISGITEVKIYGILTEKDKSIIKALFQDYRMQDGTITISLGSQTISFLESEKESIEVLLDCKNEVYSTKNIEIENVLIKNK